MTIFAPTPPPLVLARGAVDCMNPDLRQGVALAYMPCLGDVNNHPRDFSDGRFDIHQGSANASLATLGTSPYFVASPWGPAAKINGSTDIIQWDGGGGTSGKHRLKANQITPACFSCGFRYQTGSTASRAIMWASDQAPGASWRGHYFFVDETNKYLSIGASDGSTNLWSHYDSQNSFVTANAWHHVIGQFSPNFIFSGFSVNLLVDGVHATTVTLTNAGKPLAHNTNPACIGRNSGASSIMDVAWLYVWHTWGDQRFGGFDENQIMRLFEDPFAPLRSVDDSFDLAAFRRASIGGSALQQVLGLTRLAG